MIALAAATAGLARYTSESTCPIRPTKFRFVVETHRSPAARIPIYPPRHGPHVGVLTIAPAWIKVCTSPSSIAWEINLLRRRDHNAAHAFFDVFSLHHLRRAAQIVDAPVRARSDDNLIDFDLLCDFIDRLCVFRQVRERNGRFNLLRSIVYSSS